MYLLRSNSARIHAIVSCLVSLSGIAGPHVSSSWWQGHEGITFCGSDGLAVEIQGTLLEDKMLQRQLLHEMRQRRHCGGKCAQQVVSASPVLADARDWGWALGASSDATRMDLA